MLLKLNNIHKSYNTDQGGPVKKVLEGISMELDQGENMAILGPSGSGKSTLLNIIGALDRPDSGDVVFEGNAINDYTEDQLAGFRNQQVGFIFQSHHLLPQCSVLENVLVPTLPLKDPKLKKECFERAQELIKEVGLWEQKDQLPGTISGGECQRVAVIRALINKPKLLLADEPTGSLDRKNAQGIASLLMELNKGFNTALIIVTHSLEIGAQMSRAFDLVDGQLVKNK
ncbi:MAG: ABC transporter ATP-binding protein [Cyclobacteriaceae bacterium]|nr:ABC transporter ATP-binding protein [Cyclobacteriaceae bacterium]